MGDKLIEEITADDVREFLAWLRTEYKTRRMSGSERPLSPKSLHNVWIALCAFFTWTSKEFNFESPMKGVPAPKFEYPPIEPFTKEQIEALLKASIYTREANTDRRRRFIKRKPTAKRDRAIILCLLDTGLHASEFCSLTIGDINQKTGKIHGSMASLAERKAARAASFSWARVRVPRCGTISPVGRAVKVRMLFFFASACDTVWTRTSCGISSSNSARKWSSPDAITFPRGGGSTPRHSFETAVQRQSRFYREGDAFLPDYIEDGQALIIHFEERGSVIVAGCAHAGIVNTVDYARVDQHRPSLRHSGRIPPVRCPGGDDPADD